MKKIFTISLVFFHGAVFAQNANVLRAPVSKLRQPTASEIITTTNPSLQKINTKGRVPLQGMIVPTPESAAKPKIRTVSSKSEAH